MKNIPQIPFYFMRHGETDWNRRHIEMGSRDIPLNDRGLAQAALAAERLKSESIAQIASSPLQRATKTAEIVAEVLGKEITIINELAEHGLDKKTGESESGEDFEARVMQALEKSLSLSGPVLIVAHGDVYCVVQRALGRAVRSLQNCGIVYYEPPVEDGHLWGIHDL